MARQVYLGQRLCQGHGVCIPSGTLDKHAIHIGAIWRSQRILALHMLGPHEKAAVPFMALHDVTASPQCHTKRLGSLGGSRLQRQVCICRPSFCWNRKMRITAELKPACALGTSWSLRLAHSPLASTHSQKQRHQWGLCAYAQNSALPLQPRSTIQHSKRLRSK